VRLLYDSTYEDVNGISYDLIPTLQKIVAAGYPGTKTAITDYSFGGEESMSGAIAQTEAMAIMGTQGLDLATMTSSQGPITDATYLPTQMAFNFFLNYDGAGSKFGDGSLNTASADSTQLTVYAAQRSSDGKITVLVFNKTYQDETSALTLTTSATTAQVYQYSNANLAAIASQSAATVTNGSTTLLFPAQSITLLVF
jgi:glycine cleavage system protein P-like pyridoxal-binding family